MTAFAQPAPDLLARIWADLGGDPARLRCGDRAASAPCPSPLARASHPSPGRAWRRPPSPLRDLVGAHGLPQPDPDRIAVAYSSERHFRWDGDPVDAWAPLSGFFRSSDGWVRTHGNYPHHAAALRRGLGLEADADKDVGGRRAAWHARRRSRRRRSPRRADSASASRTRTSVVDAELRAAPIVEVLREGSAAARPRGVVRRRTRRCAASACSISRVSSRAPSRRAPSLCSAPTSCGSTHPQLPEPEWQHLDSGHGKRSALLDLTDAVDRATFDHLLETADVVVTGYRARALERLGLGLGDAHGAASRNRRRAPDRVGVDGSDG